jgi:hypothetical protein
MRRDSSSGKPGRIPSRVIIDTVTLSITQKPFRSVQAILWIVGAALVVYLWAKHVTPAPIDRDSAQSVQMAVNLAHYGVISLDEKPPLTPSDYREPVPVLVSAAGIRLIEGMLGPADAGAYFNGPRLQYLKYQNLLWLALLCFGVFQGIEVILGSRPVAWVGAALASVVFSANSWAAGMIDDLYTDLPAAAVLVVASAVLARGVAHKDLRSCVLAGVLFGCLTLIKAAMLYVFVAMVAILAVIHLVYARRAGLHRGLRYVALATLAFGCTVTPWMLRNRVELGTFQVAQRAGVVLWVRAVKDMMTPEEYLGSFYVWAPGKLQAQIGKLLGFGPADLQKGGRLQHLNRSENSDFAASDLEAERNGRPQDAVSYYRRARAERVRLGRELVSQGAPNPEVLADQLLQKKAIAVIREHPLRHLATTIPFAWRGAALALPMLLVGLALALRSRRYDCALFVLPAFGLVMFYALLSHFIPRYSMPVRPVMLVLAVVAAKLVLDSIRERRAAAPVRAGVTR